MLDRSKIIQKAFMRVGEVFGVINDIRAELTKIADLLLEDIQDTTCRDNSLLFNARFIKANPIGKIETKNGDAYRYEIPQGFLSIANASDHFQIIGEEIFSKADDLEITYLYTLDIVEYPNYMNEYVTLCLAVSMGETIEAYESKLQYVTMLKENARVKINNAEGVVFDMPQYESTVNKELNLLVGDY